jgi:hypothetical protein
MQISYDDEGRILAVSPLEGVLTGDNILSIPDDKAPEDLLATFALGRYIVRKGKLEQAKNAPEPPDDDPMATLSELFPAAPARRRPKK